MMVSHDSSDHSEQELNVEKYREGIRISNFGHMASHDRMTVNNESGRMLKGSVEA
jgi:hypothetical protein